MSKVFYIYFDAVVSYKHELAEECSTQCSFCMFPEFADDKAMDDRTLADRCVAQHYDLKLLRL